MMTTSATTPTTRERALTEEEILGAALEIIEEEGIDGLTMRKLSSRLGVALGATYHHVRNKDSLLVLVARSLFERVTIPPLDDLRDWTEQVREVLLSVTDVFTGQGELAAWILGHFADTAPHEIMVRMHAMLLGAGFDAEATEDALNALFFYVAGTLIGGFTTFGTPRQSRGMRQRFERGLDVILSGIRAEHLA
jgi:AcrR family transcriptional regulator